MKTFLLPPEDSGRADDLSGADIDLQKSDDAAQAGLPCVLVFNASDPSGAGGLACDALAIASVGAHMLPVVTGAYARDTAEIFDHFAFDEEAVSEQARTILEDVEVQLIKVGFAGTPENLAEIAETASDYPELPVVAYMPNLAWWEESKIDAYLDAFRELVLPQTTVLVGNHSTLWRWLLPDWSGERPPSARDIARAAGESGVPYTLVTGIVLPDQFFDNVLASPQAVLASEKYERLEAVFSGAGDTLSATLRRCWPAAPNWCRPPASRSATWTAAWMRASARAWATSFPTACSGPSPRTRTANPTSKAPAISRCRRTKHDTDR